MRTFLSITFLTFFIPMLSFGQCLSGDCQGGYGKFQYTNGDIYIGEFDKDKPQGQGVCYYASGQKYVGSWKSGQINGYGRMYEQDGSIKDGVWENSRYKEAQSSNCILGDCQNGYGLLWLDNVRYVGHFSDGKPSSQGVLFYNDGSRFVGECKDFQKNGVGVFFHTNGKIESGVWNNNQLMLERSSLGCIEGNCDYGEGVYIYSDNTRYEGSFVSNVAEGEGTCYYSSGDMYTGGWKNHTFHGYGTMYVSDGTILKGYWKDGKYIGKASRTYDLIDITKEKKSKTWFLLIGVARYQNLKSLKYTDDDAYRMYSFAKSNQGGLVSDQQINILIDEDATMQHIYDVITALKTKVNPNDNVIIYYSGHIFGTQLLPIDAKLDENTIPLSALKVMLASLKVKEKVVIVDGKSLVRGTVGSYQEELEGSDVTFLVAGRENEMIYEDAGFRQGIFSHYFIKGLKGAADFDQNNQVTLLELFQYTREEVGNHTQHQQTPVLFGKYPSNFQLSWLPTK